MTLLPYITLDGGRHQTQGRAIKHFGTVWRIS